MPSVSVQISRYIDDHFPGLVECMLVDALSEQHLFLEKAPIVTSQDLGPGCPFPQPGLIACEVEASWLDEAGRGLVRINTEAPWGIQSTTGATRFVVLQTQLSHNESDA